MHIPPEFYFKEKNESDGLSGLQYGTNEISISDFFDSVVNWDELSYEESGSDEQNSKSGLFQNNCQTTSSSDASMGQVYNVINDYEQPINYNTVASGDTGIRIRTRPVQNEQRDMNFAMQGTAQRRIRLVKHALGSNEIAIGESGAQEGHNLKPDIAGVRKFVYLACIS